jgi:crotonobetainyl-CoA:carnitine CoA-transferase CaiB-like acyl-CoA transferase
LILLHADVVVHNLKPGVMERCGLDAATLRGAKPELIYCNITAFGQSGPLRDAPGYDPLVQATSGMMSLIGHPGDPPVRVPVSINDMGTGMWAAIGILSAFLERQGNGRGATVDASLYETALAWLTVQLTDYLNSGVLPVQHGSGNANIVPYQAFACSDGQLMIAAGIDVLFQRLCEALGLSACARDERFATNAERIRNRGALIALLNPVIKKQRVEALRSTLDRLGVPCGPINTFDRVVSHAQTEALQIICRTPGDDVQTVGLPLSFNRVRPSLAGRSPTLGEHNDLLNKL